MPVHIPEIMVEILTSPAIKGQAYLDPGSGSFILQLLIASLVGIGFALRSYWGKITGFFRKDKGEGSSEDEKVADEE
ncbi:MAG: hypothetical protein PVF83_00545 [Anaerolineales bacterium]|jgi:hypothetical protein